MRRVPSAVIMASLGLLVLAQPGVAAGDAPTRSSIPFSTSGVDRTTCGFRIDWTASGTFEVTSFVDQNGAWWASITRWVGTEIDTNAKTGTSITGTWREIDFETSGSIAVVGPIYLYPVPGYGNVLVETGRFVLDLGTGEWIFAAGRTDWETGNVSAWCAALA
jgi:hypothetical protein